MANLLYPTEGMDGRELGTDPGIPFIIGDDGNYVRGYNLYLQGRCAGRFSLNGQISSVRERRLSKNSIHAVGHRLTNFTSWLYTPAAHPTEGILDWRDVQHWHIKELYREAMVLGFWTEEYWWTGQKPSLNFASTIGPRIKEVLACYRWMEAEGIIEKHKIEPSVYKRQIALREAREALKFALPSALQKFPKDKKFVRRRDPGNWAPLTNVELKTILKCIKSPAVTFAALMYLMTGMRLAELVDNTLLPGTVYRRTEYEREKATYPEKPYLLKYDTQDNAMLGVIPSLEVVFQANAPKLLNYRIIGKNKKVREVWLLSSLLKKVWKHRLLAASDPAHTAKLLLNSQGRSLTPRVIEYHLQSARTDAEGLLQHPIPITPHVLRHTFACYFLEVNISARATKSGLNPDELTRKQIEEFGGDVLPVLQELLGHAWLEDTMKYLRQLVKGKLGFQYLEAFSTIIEELSEDEI